MKRPKPLSLLIDPEHLRARLEERLAMLGKTARGASREAELSESALRNIMEGKSRSPRIDTIMSLARVLDVEPDWFLESARDPASPASLEQSGFVKGFLRDHSESLRSLEAGIYFNSRLPLIIPRVIDGFMHFPGKPFAFFEHPLFTRGNDLQYVIMVRCALMWPVFRLDDLLLVDPELETVCDEEHLFLQRAFAASNVAKLARLVSDCGDHFLVRIFNPETEIRLDKSEWSVAHRVAKRLALP